MEKEWQQGQKQQHCKSTLSPRKFIFPCYDTPVSVPVSLSLPVQWKEIANPIKNPNQNKKHPVFLFLFFFVDKNAEIFPHQEGTGTEHYVLLLGTSGMEQSKSKLNA